MPQSLLDRLVELIKQDYPEDWRFLCHHAHADDSDVPPESAARRYLRSYRRPHPMDPVASVETTWLCWLCIQHFVDVFGNQMKGRIKDTPEMKPLDPALVKEETLRFYPDELVLDEGALIIVDVQVEPAPGEQYKADAPVVTTGADEQVRKSPRRKKPRCNGATAESVCAR
jgi:hypothetical protein